MSLLDGILGQAGEGVTVQNLAKRVGLTPDEAGSAVSALGQAHVQDGDTVQTASEATGLPGDKLNEIVHNIQEVKTLSGALPRWLRARVDWPAFWEGCPSFSSSQKPGSFIQGGVSDGFTSQSSSRSSVHRVGRGSHVPGNRRSPSPLWLLETGQRQQGRVQRCRAERSFGDACPDHNQHRQDQDNDPSIWLHQGGQRQQDGLSSRGGADPDRNDRRGRKDHNKNDRYDDRLHQMVQPDEGGMPDSQFVISAKDKRGPGPKARSLGHSSSEHVRGQ
jgi:hypothetical protein